MHYGFGRHQYYLTDYQFQEFKRYTFGEWIQTFITLMFTKVSICLLLRRISTNKFIRKSMLWLMVSLILSTAALCLCWILQCVPVDAAWNLTKQPHARCMSKGQLQRIIIAQASKVASGSNLLLVLTPFQSYRSSQTLSLRVFRSFSFIKSRSQPVGRLLYALLWALD